MIGGAFLPGKALLPVDLLSAYPAWEGAFENPKVSNSLLSDIAFQFYPWHKLAYEEVQANGHIPLWNPYELSGQPIVANAQSAFYYPPNLLLNWFKAEGVSAICALFNLIFLGLFIYYFCREIKLRQVSSLFAVVSATFCGPVIVWLGYPHLNAIAPLPLIFLAGERIINNRRLISSIGMLGVGIGLSLLGGHPETTFHMCFAFSLYFIFRLITVKPGIKKGVLWLSAILGGVFIGLLLGAIQWVPFVEFLLDSATLAEGGRSMGGTSIFYSAEWGYNITTLVTFLIPNFFGSPITHNYIWPFPTYQNYNEQSVYFGLIPLAMSLYALITPRRRSQAMILVGISLFFLAVAWRLPGFESVNHIPPFSLLLNKRLKMFIPLMMAIVAAIGLDEWLDDSHINKFKADHRILVLLPAFVSLVIFGYIGFISIFPQATVHLNIQTHNFLEQIVHQVFNLNQPRIIVSFIVAGALILLYIFNLRKIINHKVLGISAITITLLELLVIGWNYNPIIDRKLIYPEIPILAAFKPENQPFRTLSTDLLIFPPNSGSAYRVAQIEGYDLPVASSFFDIYKAQGGEKASHRQVWSIDFPLVDWLNVRYILSKTPIQKDGYVLVMDQPEYKLYRNENAYPRAFMVYDYRVIEDTAKLLTTMISNPEDLRNMVLFDTLPEGLPKLRIQEEKPQSNVNIIKYAMNSVLIDVTSTQAGFLVMSDLYMKGWKVTIDGRESPIIRANYTYRAISITEGKHEVMFYYEPNSYFIGKYLSLSGWLVSLSILLFSLRKLININGLSS